MPLAKDSMQYQLLLWHLLLESGMETGSRCQDCEPISSAASALGAGFDSYLHILLIKQIIP